MSGRFVESCHSSISLMSDPLDLGLLVGTLSACLSEAMLRAITLCSKLDGDKNKQSFLKQYRADLLASGRDTAYVDKTMTTMNQCCLKGMVFYYMDPELNKDSLKCVGAKEREPPITILTKEREPPMPTTKVSVNLLTLEGQ